LIEKREHITTQYVKAAGQTFVLLGGAPTELGGSYYLKVMHDLKVGQAPAIDLETEGVLHSLLLSQIEGGRVAAAHDLSEGGLLVALAEMLFTPAGDYGAEIDLSALVAERFDVLLYGESQSRAILAVDSADVDGVLSAANEAGVPAAAIGVTTSASSLSVKLPGEGVPLSWKVADLQAAWENAIPSKMVSQ